MKVFNNQDLVSGSDDGTIKIWDVGNGAVKKEIKVDSGISLIEILKNGNLVCASLNSIIIWD